MNVRDAAAQVLSQAPDGLSAKEITDRAIESKLWIPEGKTPAATMAARISTDIKALGATSRFERIGPNRFRLRQSSPGKVPTPKPAVVTAPSSPAVVDETKTCSFTDATERVLRENAERKPMHYRDIAQQVMTRRLVATQGKTPEATLYAQVLTEIKRDQRLSRQSRFVQHGKGLIGLAIWMGRGLTVTIDQHNQKVRNQLLENLREMEWGDFETLVAELLVHLDFEDVVVTRRSGDGGIDVRAVLVVGDAVRIRMAVQVKKWKKGNNVQSPHVQQVRGSLGAHEHGLLITTSDIGKGAREEAARANAVPVALINGEQFSSLLMQAGIGVSLHAATMYDLDQDWIQKRIVGAGTGTGRSSE